MGMHATPGGAALRGTPYARHDSELLCPGHGFALRTAPETIADVAFWRRSEPGTLSPAPEPIPDEVGGRGRSKKDHPTPSRREAEAARRQRVNRTLTKKEARAESSRQARSSRMRAMSARDNTPEKTLLRDYLDSRFSLGELLLPSLALILVTSLLGSCFPRITVFATLAMYAFLLLVVVDALLKFRGFRRVLGSRLPGSSSRGLLMYTFNRCIQIRRFRMPPPRVKRGDAY